MSKANGAGGRSGTLDTPDYTSIIDNRTFDRLLQTLEDARQHGAMIVQLVAGSAFDSSTRKIAPHIVSNAPDDSALMQREIFKAILPLRGYTSLDAVIKSVNARPWQPAIYPFSNDRGQAPMLLDYIMSDGVSVNDAWWPVGQNDLPFCGVGDCGIGHYHGHKGFKTFSKMRPVFYQARFSALKFLAPAIWRIRRSDLDLHNQVTRRPSLIGADCAAISSGQSALK